MRLIGELLDEHLAVDAAVEDADADFAEVAVEDIGTVAGGVHEAFVRDQEGGSESEVFARRQCYN